MYQAKTDIKKSSWEVNEMRLEIKEDFDKLQCTETMKEETKKVHSFPDLL